MSDERTPLTKLVNRIYRYTQAYTNEVLEKYRLGSGTYPFLLSLWVQEGVNQNQISKELNIDKAMSARAIKRLIELGYIKKVDDRKDSRAFNLYLTEKARAVVPAVKDELRVWNEMITEGLDEDGKEQVIDLLGRILENAKAYKNRL